jgi:predicted dehydrogenase
LNAPTLNLEWKPPVPRDLDRGIGIVGAGAIVAGAHLPAYRKAGFNVLGITNRTRSRAEALAAEFAIPHVYDDLDAMLANDAIEIIDIAVAPWTQYDLAVSAAQAGRHLLCQKPMHEELAEARSLVAAIAATGVKLAVNQQLRWDGRMRAVRQLLDEGWIGRPTLGTISVHINNPWNLPFLQESKYQELMYHSIHYFDTIRYLFGEPDRLFCSTGSEPPRGQGTETRSTSVLEYDGGPTVLVHCSTDNPTATPAVTFRFEGSEGLVSGDYDLFTGGGGNPETLSIYSTKLGAEPATTVTIPERRVPDAFIGPMASLMCAIEDDTDPDPSGQDNLGTLRLVHAAYLSAAEHRVVAPSELDR